MRSLARFIGAVIVLWGVTEYLRPRNTVAVIESSGKAFSNMIGVMTAVKQRQAETVRSALFGMDYEERKELYDSLTTDDMAWVANMLHDGGM